MSTIESLITRINADIDRLLRMLDRMGPERTADRIFIQDVIRRRQEMIEQLQAEPERPRTDLTAQ